MKVSTRPQATVKARAETTPSHRPFDIAAILIFAFAAVILVGLATRDSGILGRTVSSLCYGLFGKGAWAVPVVLSLVGWCFVRGKSLSFRRLGWGVTLMFLALLGAFASAIGGNYFDPEILAASGGYVGGVLAWLLATLLGAGKGIGLIAMALVGLVLSIDMPIRTMLERTGRGAAALKQKTLERPRRTPKPITPAPKKEAERKPVRVRTAEPVEDPVVLADLPVETRETIESPAPKRKPVVRETVPLGSSDDADLPRPKEGYELPPINLLAEALMNPKRTEAEMEKNIETLEGTLEQFGIDATVVEVAHGPTVTRYEIQLGPGIKVSRITALADNIAMDLAASMVRVEAPIPGKAAIGVEVPNESPTMVTLRELCDDPTFKNHPSRLAVALGKDVSGVNRYADLTKMPHLLIGGATNSGKSIGLATLITSLLMRNTPKDVRMVMIDPKRVELTLFDSIPHLMCPVIKDVKEAPGVLRAVWREMDRRYDLFSNEGVRNIDGWNAKASFQDKLPYIVVVIDELADLMIQSAAEVETVIVRLAQLSRAVGIHLVIATQRPSVDVITGLIKANIPSRLAFSVASAIDSRTILDMKGAEALIGKGDMLFMPIDANKPARVQGCFVSEREIDAICKFWRAQEPPQYVLSPVDEDVADAKKEGGDFDGETDPLWEEAVRWVAERGQASTSMIQRKFSIGFQRASRLLDMMEERSIVGPRDGPRPREVLVSNMDVDSLFGNAPKYDVGNTIDDDPNYDE
jgi:DNA segregation ATPase FtsK/SpoIIIE, S-DNA-T family